MIKLILTIIYAIIPFLLAVFLYLTPETMAITYILFLLAGLIVYGVYGRIRHRNYKLIHKK